MTAAPSISVIVPLYNKAPYVVRAVRSALQQEPAPAEILIIDDGSTDGGPALLRALPEFPRLRIVAQRTAGEGAARNRGLAEMRGALAAFLDADDEWLPGHLANLLEIARECPQAGLLATGYRSIYAAGVQVETALDADRPAILRDYFETACGGLCLHISSCAARRDAALAAGGFAESEPLGADIEFFAKMALRQPVALHPRISGVYYAAQPQSALRRHAWSSGHPPVVRWLRGNQARGIALPQSAERYADYMLAEHALTGVCRGGRDEARAVLHRVGSLRALPARSQWPARLAAAGVPHMVMRPLIRAIRSRFAVGDMGGHPAVVNRVCYGHD